MRVGVLADTHIPSRARAIPQAVLDAFRVVDLIVHAGDLATGQVLTALRRLAPVHAVYGNVDEPELKRILPRRLVVAVDDARLAIIHGDSTFLPAHEIARRAFGTDEIACVIYGHSHMPECVTEDGVLYFNPGSPTDRRKAVRCSYGILSVEQGRVEGALYYL